MKKAKPELKFTVLDDGAIGLSVGITECIKGDFSNKEVKNANSISTVRYFRNIIDVLFE